MRLLCPTTVLGTESPCIFSAFGNIGLVDAMTNDTLCCEALERIADAVLTVDREARITYLNKAAQQFFGRTSPDLLGRALWDVFPEAVQSQLYVNYIKSIREQVITRTIDHYSTLNKWIEVHVYPSADGATICFRDVTIPRDVEVALRESEERLRLAAEAGGIGIWSWDFSTGMQTADAHAREIMGLPKSVPITTEMVLQIIHPDDRERIDQAVHKAMVEHGVYEAEFRVVRPNGEIRWVYARGHGTYDRDNRPLYLTGMVTDITERKQKELLNSTLTSINLTIRSGVGFDTIVQTAMEEGIKALHVDVGLVSLREDDYWVVRYGHRVPDGIIGRHFADKEIPFASLAASENKTVVIDDVETDERLDKAAMRRFGIRSAIVAPLVIKGVVIGALLFGYHTTHHAFTSAESEFVTNLATSVSLALANARLIADLDTERRFIARILNVVPVVVTYIGRDLVFYQANEAAARAFGSETKDIVGHKMAEIVNGNNEMIEHVKTVFRTGKPLHTAGDITYPSGAEDKRTRHYLITYVPDVDEQGQVVGVIQEAEDVTELERLRIGMEEALAKAETTSKELQRALDRERQYSIMLQRALLPEVPEVPEGYAVATTYVSPFAGREIGGDFYDVFRTERGGVGILIGDVAGKGLEAASIAAAARATVRAFAYEMSDTGEVLTHANAVLHSQRPSDLSILFVTLFLGILDPTSGKMRYCSAGHPPPAVFHATSGEIDFFRFGDPPIGLLDKYSYHEAAENIYPGDKVVFYTDGISEARQDSDLFGEEGIERSIKRHHALAPTDLVAHLLAEATEWAGGHLRDDAAIVVLERIERSA